MRFRYAFLLLVLALAFVGCDSTADGGATTPATPAGEYAAFVLRCCDETEARIPELTALAEQVAEMHAGGGMLGVIWEPPSSTGPQGPQYEIKGRSGGLGAFDVNLAKQANADRSKDVAIIGWQRAPEPGDLEILKKYREKYFIIAFGPKELPGLAEHVKLCDAWIDTGLGADDRAVALPDGTRAGQGNALVNALNAWAFLGELTAALTRKGKTPVLLKSHAWEDSKAWNTRYRGKMNFHDDLQIKPIPAGTVSREYLNQLRDLVTTFAATQGPAIDHTAGLIVEELKQGKKTVVAQTGHTTFELVGKYEDAAWAQPVVLYETAGRIKQYPELTADGALVLRLGYSGMEPALAEVLKQKKQRVMIITSNHDARPEYKVPDDYAPVIDMGWAFGDACVQIEGYPIRVFPPSGVMQMVAYEAVNVRVLARLAKEKGGQP
ncbi:MAG: hypothetical protein ACYC6A_07340 [Armatimonadota bacterium]